VNLALVYLEVKFYEEEDPPWAEWEMWREKTDGSSEWIARGTTPSLEAAVDAAVEAAS
jgi:hypothetical protein